MRYSCAGLVLLAALVGCRHADADDRAAGASPDGQVAAQGRTSNGATNASLPLAKAPSSDCEWIPVADVEAIVGKLAEPPRLGEGGCVYTLPIPQQVAENRTKAEALRAKWAKEPGGERFFRPDTQPYAFALEVRLDGIVMADRAAKVAGSFLAAAFKSLQHDTTHAAQPQSPISYSKPHTLDGWDAPAYPIGGRTGHLRISLTPLAEDLELPREKLLELAARVRDRIPDLPFAYSSGRYSETAMGDDPCSLLTRAEAEAVLGKVLVPPYRTYNDGPLAYDHGTSCGYYTAGHHVFILAPRWRNGKQLFGIVSGLSGLVAKVANDGEAASADTLEGPWDQAGMEPDGSLALLKGDKMLAVSFALSSTKTAGALKLAKIAITRLAEAKR